MFDGLNNDHNGPAPLLVWKINKIVLTTNKYLIFECNALALFTFYTLPSSGKDKCVLVHFECCILLRRIDIVLLACEVI